MVNETGKEVTFVSCRLCPGHKLLGVCRRSSDAINTLMRLWNSPFRLESSIKVVGEYFEAEHVEQLQHPGIFSKMVSYLPIHSLYDETKEKTQLFFDSSAIVRGLFPNDALLQGPDEDNKLTGVLMRFKIGEICFSADIEKMLHSFYVNEEHRDLLQFYYFRNNCPDNDIVEHRANLMILGNKAYPACANFGLRYTPLFMTKPKIYPTHVRL